MGYQIDLYWWVLPIILVISYITYFVLQAKYYYKDFRWLKIINIILLIATIIFFIQKM